MAELWMDVPLTPQTKSNGCWHACIRMIKAFAGENVKLGAQKTAALQKAWDTNAGTRDYTGLARAEGFVLLSYERPKYTCDSLLAVLKKFGPLWTNTTDGATFQHAVVICGVTNATGEDRVFINDPWPINGGTSTMWPLEQLNALAPRSSQMYYPPNAAS